MTLLKWTLFGVAIVILVIFILFLLNVFRHWCIGGRTYVDAFKQCLDPCPDGQTRYPPNIDCTQEFISSGSQSGAALNNHAQSYDVVFPLEFTSVPNVFISTVVTEKIVDRFAAYSNEITAVTKKGFTYRLIASSFGESAWKVISYDEHDVYWTATLLS